MIEEHAQAILTLLGAAITNPYKVFDGKVPDGVDARVSPYVVVYFDSSDPEFDFQAQPHLFQLTVTCHSVGGSALTARRVADLVRAALVAVVPTVAGRACFPITREDGTPPQRDESTGVLVMDQIDLYTLRSVPG